jgi:hypothetical protein
MGLLVAGNSLCAAGDKGAADVTAGCVAHPVQLTHPAVGKRKPAPCTLYQARGEKGLPTGYHMVVNSVVCRKKTCEVLAGRMYWDAIGRYQRYELPPGKQLTRKNHATFTPQEYARLDRLLRNRNSPLRDYAHKKLTAPGAWDDIDAVTGATANEIKAEVVAGAGYTCYTLWHWANGDVVGEIRGLTAASLDTALACRLLAGGDKDAVLFALKNLESRNLHDAPVVAAVRKVMPDAGSEALMLSLGYLCRSSQGAGAFYRDTADLFWKLRSRGRQSVLDFVEAQPNPAPIFFDELVGGLPNMTEYYEIHRVLALVEKHRHASPRLIPRVVVLLEHDNFFIARRAYWFLENRELGEAERTAVGAFRRKYGSRL